MCKIDSECHPNITAMQINLELYLETLFTDVLTQRFGVDSSKHKPITLIQTYLM